MRYRSHGALAVVVAGALIPPSAVAQPQLVWETTVSVTDELEGADEMVVDAAGNVIVLGYLPVERDFYVMKFDPAGELRWSRVIGGSGLDLASGLAVDDAGDVYLAGRSLSDDFPTVRAYQPTKNGPSDAILMKLDGDDGTTLFSTYFGGSRGEWAFDVALGSDGTITIVGQTDSIDFATVNPIQDGLTLTECFCEDAFVTRFSPEADAVLFSTYLGGAFDDVANAVGVDDEGNVTFAGRTKSGDFPALNAAQPAFGGGEFDGFVARITADDTLAYSTFLGGEDWELVQGIGVDGDGAAYVAGSTRSIGYPTTAGAFQEEFVGGVLACEVPFGPDRNCYDMFVTKLDPDGAYAYSTFIGGHSDDEPRNIVVDRAGRAHVAGYTYSDDFPREAPFGTVVVLRLDAEGSGIDYAVVHDTPGANAGSAVAVQGLDLFLAASVGLPYDTYVAKLRGARAPADVNGDGFVDFVDLLIVLSGWGPCPPEGDCPGDVDGDGMVDFDDLLAVLESWGPAG